jgi:hypothetical protein
VEWEDMPKPITRGPSEAKRGLRGMETAQAVLLLVIAVAITLALWLVVSGMVTSTSAPVAQVDPTGVHIENGRLAIPVKSGIHINRVEGAAIHGTYLNSGCSFSPTYDINPGQYIWVYCPIPPPGTYQVEIAYDGGHEALSQFYWAGS